MRPNDNLRTLLWLLVPGIACLLGAIFLPKPYYIFPGLGAISVLVMVFIVAQRALNHAAKHPFIGRRFCTVDMRGCDGMMRGEEKWGTIMDVDTGKCQRGEIYDGNASAYARKIMVARGQDTWALVLYDDGSERWEPCWWFVDKKTHLEYPT